MFEPEYYSYSMTSHHFLRYLSPWECVFVHQPSSNLTTFCGFRISFHDMKDLHICFSLSSEPNLRINLTFSYKCKSRARVSKWDGATCARRSWPWVWTMTVCQREVDKAAKTKVKHTSTNSKLKKKKKVRLRPSERLIVERNYYE